MRLRRSTPAPIGRVMVGVWEISNMVFTIADALREAGYEAETILIDTPDNRFFRVNKYDRLIRVRRGETIQVLVLDWLRFRFQMAREFLRAVRRFDTFVFVWYESFLPAQLDRLILRLLGKNVVVFFCGADVRYKPIQIQLDPLVTSHAWYPVKDPEAFAKWMAWTESFRNCFWRAKLAEKTGCKIVATRDCATFQGRPYAVFMMPQRMLVDEPREPAERPLIIHAPTDRALKGTTQVEAAIAQLRAEGLDFDFQLITGMPATELDELLKRTDIVIDQPGVWPGRFGVTAMAAGTVVVGGNQPDYWLLPDESPVQQFERDADELAALLRGLIRDRERRGELMAASFEYARQMYSYPAFVSWFAELSGGEIPFPIEPIPDQKRIVRSLAPTPAAKLAVSLFW